LVRLVSSNLVGVAPEQWPPRCRRGPVRALFIDATVLGRKTYSRAVQRYTATRDDIDAVHIEYRIPLWQRVLGKSLPFARTGWDLHQLRHMLMTGVVLGRWLRRRIPLERFDVIHAQAPYLSLAMTALPRPLPFGVTTDGTSELDCRDFGDSRTARTFFRTLEKRIYGRAAYVAAYSEWAAASLRADYGVPDSKIIIAPPAMPVLQPAPRRSPEGWPLRILFVGNDPRRKGLDRLLRWHQQRWAERAELHVVSSRCKPDPSARNVVWHGSIERSRLLDAVLPEADLFVLPTKEDMFAWAALEACAAGLPVVVSRVGATAELVRDGVTGLLCRWDDDAAFIAATESLLGDPALRRRLGRAARDRVAQHFSPDVSFGRLIDGLVAVANQGERAWQPTAEAC
jgi:glycosyltransferase involved in cell wall biosynthesis